MVIAPLREKEEHDGYFSLIRGDMIMVRDPMVRVIHAVMYVPNAADFDDASSIWTRKINPDRDVSISQLERNVCRRDFVMNSSIGSPLSIFARYMRLLCMLCWRVQCPDIELRCNYMHQL